MKQEPLSPAQLQLLVWAGLTAPVVECFPGLLLSSDGRSAWSSVLTGGLLAVGLSRLLRLCGSRPAHRLKEGLGRIGGTAVLFLYMVWVQLLLTLRLSLCADRLLLWGQRDGSRLFFLGVMTLLLLRVGRTSLDGFARAGQIFFAGLALTALLILALSLPSARWERLFPGALPPLSGTLRAAGVLSWAFPAVFLPARYEDGRGGRLRWDLLAVLVLTLSQGILLANLGPGLAGRVDVPFFTLAKSVGVEGAFQRAESAVAALWIFGDLVLAGVLLHAQRQLLHEVTDHEELGMYLSLTAAFLGALRGLPDLSALSALGLLPALLLPLLIRMTEALRRG